MMQVNRLASAQVDTAAPLTVAAVARHERADATAPLVAAATLPFDERLLVFLFDRKQPLRDQHQHQHAHQQQQQQQQPSSRQRDLHYARFRARHVAHFDGGALRLAREAIDARSAAWLAEYLSGNMGSMGSLDNGPSSGATSSIVDASLSDECGALYFSEWDFAGNDALGCAGARALASAMVARCHRAQAAASAQPRENAVEDTVAANKERRDAEGRRDQATIGIGNQMTRHRRNVPAVALRALDLSGCGLRMAGFVALANGMPIWFDSGTITGSSLSFFYCHRMQLSSTLVIGLCARVQIILVQCFITQFLSTFSNIAQSINNFSPRPTAALSAAPCLHALNLSNSATAAKNTPREAGALALAAALRSEQCSLRELKLDGIGAVAAAIVLAFGMRARACV